MQQVVQPEIISVKELLEDTKISIPYYQRPYKWSLKHINQLIDDIINFKDKPAYRLGTIVFYNENNSSEKFEIVDGQQRTISLLLISLAILRNKKLQEEIIKHKITCPRISLFDSLEFDNVTSQNNIRDNFREVERRIVYDISEAFQFFDSQNARGKDLSPHDLLKAFHLREMIEHSSEKERIKTVEDWENLDSKALENLFSKNLFRIRNWSKGKSARTFTKSDSDNFKGISPGVTESYPFTDIYRISHFYVNGYNEAYHRNIDKNYMGFPFQIDQVVINGKRFFEMISHYYVTIDRIKSKSIERAGMATIIFETIDNYEGKNRTGDKYVRNLFDNALVYYIDKFGDAEFDRAIEKIFFWTYSLRLKLHSVQLASIDNHAREYPSVFKIIKNALKPNDFLNTSFSPMSSKDIKSNKKTEKITELFKSLNYLYE